MFEWDEAKRETNIAKHGLDFIRARLVFDGRPAINVPAVKGEEPRCLTIANLEGKFVTVVWTWRGQCRRIISFRRSRDGEEKAYKALYGSRA
jgi:uncharacterized DUF497 family protein